MFVRPVVRSLPVVALLAATAAAASTVVGNPILSLTLDSGSAVEIGKIRAFTCPGYEDFPVYDTLAVGEPLSVDLGEGPWCAVGIQVAWAGTSSWDLVGVDGFDTLVTLANAPSYSIALDPTAETATLE